MTIPTQLHKGTDTPLKKLSTAPASSRLRDNPPPSRSLAPRGPKNWCRSSELGARSTRTAPRIFPCVYTWMRTFYIRYARLHFPSRVRIACIKVYDACECVYSRADRHVFRIFCNAARRWWWLSCNCYRWCGRNVALRFRITSGN